MKKYFVYAFFRVWTGFELILDFGGENSITRLTVLHIQQLYITWGLSSKKVRKMARWSWSKFIHILYHNMVVFHWFLSYLSPFMVSLKVLYQVKAFLDFHSFNFSNFRFTAVYNSILFSSPLALLRTRP